MKNSTLSSSVAIVAILATSMLLTASAHAASGPDVSVALSNGVTDMSPGGTFIYTLTITNNGDASASGVQASLSIPISVDQVSVSDSGTLTHPTSSSTLVTWPSFALASKATVLRQVNVKLNNLPAGTSKTLISTATASATGDTNTANNTATYTNNLVATPDLNVTLTDGLTTLSAGATMIYTATITNTGSIAATGVTLNITVPSPATFVVGSQGSGVPAAFATSGTICQFKLTNPVAPGDSDSFQLQLALPSTLPAGTPSTLVVTATVSDDGANGADPTPSNNTAADTDQIQGTAGNFDLAIQISDGLDSISPGATMIYTLTVSNLGNVAANNVLVKANIPANTTVVSGSITNSGSVQSGFVVYPTFSLAAGATVTRQFTLALASTLPSPAPTFLSVTGTVSGDAGEACTNNNSATDCDKIVIPPTGVNLAISQCNGITSCVSGGQSITYILTISNIGSNDASGVLVTDTIPSAVTVTNISDNGNVASGVITWPTFTLTAGSSVFRSFTVQVNNPVPSGVTELVNTASVSDDHTHGPELCPCNNTTVLHNPICPPQNPDLCITKTINGNPTCVQLGTQYTYTLIIASLNSVATTGVVATDTIPANTTFVSASNGGTFANGVVTFNIGALAGNSSVTRTVTIQVASSVAANITSITNFCSVTDDGSHGADSNTSNNTYSITTPICQQAPDLMITKTINGNPTCVQLGQQYTYTLTISSLNSTATTGVVVTDTIPANTTFIAASNGGTFANGVVTFNVGAMAGNSSITRTVTVQLASTVAANVVNITNYCSVTDDGTHGADTNTANNTFSLTTPICQQIPPDLMITKTINGNPTCVQLGQQYTYTLTISSLNSTATTGVVVTDTIPANTVYIFAPNGTFANGVVTFNIGALAGNTSVTRTVTVQVANAVAANVVSITNFCSVTDDGSHGADSNTANNTFSLTTQICQPNPPDLMITKTINGNPSCVGLGQQYTYTLNISSLNSVATTGVVVTDTIPANTTFIAASNGGTFANGVVTFNVGAMAGNSTITRTVTIQLANAVAANVVSITNYCSVTDDGSHGADINPLNNTFSLTTPICSQTPPDLMITKIINGNPTCVQLGQQYTYTLTVSSLNNVATSGVMVTDTIPANTTFVSASNGGTFSNGVVMWNIGALAGNSSITLTVTVQLASAVPANVVSITNYCSVTDDGSHGADINPANNMFSLTTPICNQTPPDLMITKIINGNPTCVQLGQQYTYLLTISSLNGVATTGVVVTDTIPANTTFVSASDNGTFANGVVTWNVGVLAGNATITRSVTIQLASAVAANVVNITNFCSVTDDGTHGADSNTANNTFSLTTPICTQTPPDLMITKIINGNPTCVQLGQQYTYTLTISSLNSTATTGVVVTDTIPANTTFVAASNGGTFANGVVTFNVGAMAGNSSITRTVTVQLANAVAANVVNITNVCTVTDDGTHGADSNTANNTFTLTTPICTQTPPDLMITKVVNGNPTCVQAGLQYTYTLTISSLNSVATTGVVATDTLPANTTFLFAPNGTFANGVVTFNIGALGGNASVTRSITVLLNSTIPGNVTTITNVCTVTDDGTHGADSNTANNTFTLTTPICTPQNPDLMITKVINGNPTCVQLGQQYTYTLTISSLNSVATTGDVVTDTIPANTTFVGASDSGTFAGGVVTFPAFPLAGNSSVTRTITVQLAANVPANVVSVTNVCTVTDDHTHGTDINTANNTFTLTSPICSQTPPDLMITKIIEGNPTCVQLGQQYTYTLTISSLNATPATGVVATDTIPANTTFVSATNGGTFANGMVTFQIGALAGNSSVTRSVTVQLANAVAANVVSVTNICTVFDDGAHGQDTNTANNTFSLTTPICSQTPPDLMVTKVLDVPCITLGANLTYTITVSSLNGVATTGVVVADTIPPNTTFVSASNGGTFANGVVTFNIGALAGNSSVTLTLVVQAAATVPAGVTTMTNVVTVTDDGSHGPDSNTNNNTFTLTKPICTTTGPDLIVEQNSQQLCGSSSTLAANFIYTIKVSEASGLAVPAVSLTDTIPPNSTFVSASNGGTFANGVVTFPAFDLAAATTALRTVTVTIANPIPRPAAGSLITLTNTATATAPSVTNLAGNSSSVTDTLSNLHFVSDLSANPRPILAGVQELFTAVAADDAFPNAPITYTWTFGDGTSTTSTATTVTHVYAVSGSYLITVAAANGIGCPLGESLQTQQPPNNPQAATCQLFRAPFNLKKANADSLTLVAQITLPDHYNPAGHVITIDIAQFQFNATLNAHGNGVNLPKNQKVVVKPNGKQSLVTLKITKSNLRALLAPGVPANASTATVPNQLFLIGFDINNPSTADTFSSTTNIGYKSNGKTGVIGLE